MPSLDTPTVISEQSTPEAAVSRPVSTSMKLALLLGIIGSFILAFGSGFYLSNLLQQERLTTTTTSPTPIASLTPTITGEEPGQLPAQTNAVSKKYFLDTIFLVEKATPHRTVIASAGRMETDQGYAQSGRASYFNGISWDREVGSGSVTSDHQIASSATIESWLVAPDPSRVLQETVQGVLQIHDTPISFTTEMLTNEIGMRSLPEYTKFMSAGEGTATIAGENVPVYVLYTRIYSIDASQIQFYTEPMGVTTDWVAFWDAKGNFYHIDTTDVGKPTPIYQSHQIGIFKSALGAINKTFKVQVRRDETTLPLDFSIFLNLPINRTLTLHRTSLLDKSVAGKYDWFMSTVEGTVVDGSGTQTAGFGLLEYIHDVE